MTNPNLNTDPEDVMLTNWDVRLYAVSYVGKVFYAEKSGQDHGTALAFTFRRVWTSHLMQTYLPSFLITLGSVLSVFVPARHVPARMALCVTSFLSTVALFNGARKVPTTVVTIE